MKVLQTIGGSAVLLAVLGAAITYVVDVQRGRQARAEARRSLASALFGEIGAITALSVTRYLPVIRMARRRVRRGDAYSFGPSYTGNELFGVYRANIANLGTLPADLAEDVANLYTTFLTTQEDLRTLVQKGWDNLPAPRRVLFLADLEKRLAAVETQAAAVRTSLRAFIEKP